ncbi:hypothetical protein CP02DC23_0003B, partial [Chlamydia psittaci 02DC23]
EPPPPPTRQH